ncbi:MAG: ATP-binding domain-containing protein, partial [Agathobaculum sp.]
IYDETGALGLYGALPNGAQRQSNLLAFFERARAFEGQGFRGLFAFVRLLRGMQETGEDFQTVGAEATGGAVRILSIHKSKGLEFPIVIVADCAKQFNEADLREPVLVHKELGFGSKCRDRARGVQYDTVE